MMERFTLKEVADYLGMSMSAVQRLVHAGIIPGFKVSGRWYVDEDMLQDWVRAEAAGLNPKELASLEETKERESLCVSSLLHKKNIIVDFFSTTKSEAIGEMVSRMAAGYRVKDSQALLDAVRKREMLCSTAIARGVALPHPRRVQKERFTTTRIVMAISKWGVDFESEDGFLTHVMVLFCAPRDDTHLRVLAKLSRILRDYRLVLRLRKAETAGEALRIFSEAEKEDAARRRLKLVKSIR